MRLLRSLGGKLTAGFLTVGVLAALVMLPALQAIRRLADENRRLAQETLPVTRVLEEIRFETQRLIATIRGELRSQRQGTGAPVDVGARLTSAGERLDERLREYGGLVDRYFPDEQALRAAVDGRDRELRHAGWELARLLQEPDGSVAHAAALADAEGVLAAAESKSLAAVEVALANEAQEVAERSALVRAAEQRAMRTLIAGGVATVVAAALLGFFLARRLLAPVHGLQKASIAVAKGDLAARVERTTTDELGDLVDAFNQMVGGLRQRQQLEQVLAAMQDALLVAGADGRIDRMNLAASRLLGVAPEGAVGRPLVSFIPKYRGCEAARLDELVRRGLAAQTQAELSTELGEAIPVDFSASVIADGEGRSLGLVCVARDLRERHRAQAELHRHREWLQVTLESIGDGLIATDERGQVVFVNPVAERLTGLAQAEAVGRPIETVFHIVHEGTRAVVPNPIQRVLREGTLAELANHTLLLARDGRETPIADSAAPIRGADGRVQGAVIVFRDVSERRKVEVAMEEARRAAVAATVAKSEFLATMSHEIRTPMNGVIGMTSLLLATGLDRRQREFVETIQASGDHLLSVINDILDLSKIEAGKVALEERSFDPQRLLEEAVALFGAAAAAKDLDLSVYVAPGVPAAVVADETRVRQICTNLLSNAVKFTPRGEIEVRLESGTGGASGELRFTVRDSGIGIAAEKLPLLFKPFSQADASTSRRYGGTGLGLAISARLAELLGGELTVESRAGIGSTFRFVLPVRLGRLPAQGLGLEALERLRGRRILIVDANASSLRVLESQCRGWGLLVASAETAAEALLTLRAQRFDLALFDRRLPGVDGIELARTVRSTPEVAELPLVLLSAETAESSESGFPQLFAHTLPRPLRPSALLETLVAVLAPSGRDLGEKGAAAPGEPLATRLPLRLAVVEDNPVNQHVAEAILGSLGYEARVTASGDEFLATLADSEVDLVFLDLQMPTLDGFGVMARLRELYPRGVRPVVVALTANATREDQQLCLAAEMDDYLSKPVSVGEVEAMIERWAGKAVARARARRLLESPRADDA